MAGLNDEKFAVVVNLIETLESVYARKVYARKEDRNEDRTRIENELKQAMAQLSDEQLTAVELWREERVKQSQRVLDGLKEKLAEFQSELARRKNR